MAKYDAVDRLMAMATEKRADRTPAVQQSVPDKPPATPEVASSQGAQMPGAPAAGRNTTAERGRQLWNAIRPMLPVVAGAMRMVDHGAVQAVARLLPLVGGAGSAAGTLAGQAPAGGPARAAVEEHTATQIEALQVAQQAARKEFEFLRTQGAEWEDQMRKLRTQVERSAAEDGARTQEIRSLGDRVRLLTAGTIILLMLVVAQMILLVVIFHR